MIWLLVIKKRDFQPFLSTANLQNYGIHTKLFLPLKKIQGGKPFLKLRQKLKKVDA